MAYIKSVRFNRVGRNEGCTCDKCGQYIRNIWTVTYQDGVIMNFGTDCFEKMNKGNLNAYGQKLMKDALKWIEKHQQNFEAEKMKTAETDLAWQCTQEDKESCWYGRPYEEYHKWMLEEFYPVRFAEDQKRIDRFKKVNFER